MVVFVVFGIILGVVGFFVVFLFDELLLLELFFFCFLEGVGLVGVCFFIILGVFDFLLGFSFDEFDELLLEFFVFFFVGVDLLGVFVFGVIVFFVGFLFDEFEELLLEFLVFFFCVKVCFRIFFSTLFS